MADISKISPDNGTTIYNLKDIEARKRVPEVMLKDTVGWSGKNLLPIEVESKTIQSVVFTVNPDGSITANGTASPNAVIWDLCTNLFIKKGKYILSGCPTGASVSTYELLINKDTTAYRDYGDGVEITFDTDTIIDNVRIIVRQNATINNQTFYPMLRKADISDSTYEPYHESVEEVVGDIRAEQNVLGAKNLFDPFKVVSANSTITISNGGASLNLQSILDGTYKSGRYVVGVKANTKYRITTDIEVVSGVSRIEVKANNVIIGYAPSSKEDTSYDFTFNTGDNTELEINLFDTYSNSAAGNVTYNNFLLRLATDPDNTYVPYAMTNRELTEKVALAVVSDNANVEFQNNESCLIGRVACIRTQVHCTAEISVNTNVVSIVDKASLHPNYGAAFLVNTNSGASYELVAAPSGNSLALKNKVAIPSGWYAITYTWITS